MTGAVAANLHTGSRSELLADYFFTAMGTVTPVRRQDDYGVDLFCTIDERVGQRQWAREYYSVQVKSTLDSWEFEGADSVRWLLEHPNPVFLCVVDKAKTQVEIFSTIGRFAAFDTPQDRLELIPDEGEVGSTCTCVVDRKVTLGAPIIRATLSDLIAPDRVAALVAVFRAWIDADRQNIDLRRMGLWRFRGFQKYRTNVSPQQAEGLVEIGKLPSDVEPLLRGFVRLAEAAECLGDQCAVRGDLRTALRAGLLVKQIRAVYGDAFSGEHVSRRGVDVPGFLGQRLHELLRREGDRNWIGAGLEDVSNGLDAHPRVEAALRSIGGSS